MKYVPVTEQMLKDMFEKSKKSKKPSTKIKKITDNIFVIETKRKK